MPVLYFFRVICQGGPQEAAQLKMQLNGPALLVTEERHEQRWHSRVLHFNGSALATQERDLDRDDYVVSSISTVHYLETSAQISPRKASTAILELQLNFSQIGYSSMRTLRLKKSKLQYFYPHRVVFVQYNLLSTISLFTYFFECIFMKLLCSIEQTTNHTISN